MQLKESDFSFAFDVQVLFQILSRLAGKGCHMVTIGNLIHIYMENESISEIHICYN